MSELTDKEAQLAGIEQAILRAGVTPELAHGAKQLVFGSGTPMAEIVFVGEAPGAKEDESGQPFMGAAGRVLNEMLVSVGLERPNVYITNIVKYRPPANRDPLPDEIQAFVPYLTQQLDIIQPKLTVFLGRHSLNVFFPELKIGDAHGHVVARDGRSYLPLFHPAAALYNPKLRATLFEDFSQIPALLKSLSN